MSSNKEDLIEEIANKVVNKIDKLEYNIEISNSELWKDLINSNELDFDELFELNNRIIELCKNKEYILNFDKYNNATVGLPYHIPFIKEEKIINFESILIQLTIYYFISTRGVDEETNLKECFELLKKEKTLLVEDKTVFDDEIFKKDHIVNKLFCIIKKLSKQEYNELLDNTMFKINYYYSISKDNSIMSTQSEKDVEEISYNILYFNLGIDELKKRENVYAQYELGERYFSANMDEQAYKYFESASSQGHKLATYRKILCLFKGYGIEKNEKKAFIELCKFVEDMVCTKARVLLGEMYYFGNGTEKDYKKAYECFTDSEYVEQDAKYYLAEMYMKGLGIEKNEKKAIELLKQAVDKKNSKAIKYVIENNIKL